MMVQYTEREVLNKMKVTLEEIKALVTKNVVELAPTDYTTTNDYDVVVEYDIRPYDAVAILLKNTGGANSAYFKVAVLVNVDGQIEYDEVPETSLDPGQAYKVELAGRYAKVRVYAKSAVADAPTTIRVEAMAVE